MTYTVRLLSEASGYIGTGKTLFRLEDLLEEIRDLAEECQLRGGSDFDVTIECDVRNYRNV